MKKIYINRDRQRLDNGQNDSRYTLDYFIQNEAADFIAEKFPQYNQQDYIGIYSLGIQEVYNDTQGFAVIEWDDLTHDEAQFLLGMSDVISFMNITQLTATQARSRLETNGYTKIDNTQYEISPEFELDGVTHEATYIYL